MLTTQWAADGICYIIGERPAAVPELGLDVPSMTNSIDD